MFYLNKFFVYIFVNLFDCNKVVFKDYALCILHLHLCFAFCTCPYVAVLCN